MGYYTDFSVSWEIPEREQRTTEYKTPTSKQILEEFNRVIGYDDEWGNGFWLNAKWYNYEADMNEISRKFPAVLFHVHGDGDSPDDLWEDHWQNGRRQLCAAVIPPFDPAKMKEYRP